QAGALVEVVLGGIELADKDLELTQAVQQRRQPPLLFAGHVAVALDQFVDLLALALTPNGEAVARKDEDLVQAVAALQGQDTLVVVGQGLPLLLLFELQVQHAISPEWILASRCGGSSGKLGPEPRVHTHPLARLE